jgi:hypothetical protein
LRNRGKDKKLGEKNIKRKEKKRANRQQKELEKTARQRYGGI